MILPGSLISQRWLLLASWCLHDKCSISQMLALLRIHCCASLDDSVEPRTVSVVTEAVSKYY